METSRCIPQGYRLIGLFMEALFNYALYVTCYCCNEILTIRLGSHLRLTADNVVVPCLHVTFASTSKFKGCSHSTIATAIFSYHSKWFVWNSI